MGGISARTISRAVPTVDADGRLHADTIDAIADPASLVDLRRRLEDMLPRVDLPDLTWRSWPGIPDSWRRSPGWTAFAERWDTRFPTISRRWLEHWEHVIPFLAFPPDLRRVVYTTNTIEALNRQIRKIIKTRGHFPTEDAARKLIYLAIERAERK